MQPCQGRTYHVGAGSLRSTDDSDALTVSSERDMRFELTTSSLATRRSTTELVPQAADPVARLLDQARKLRQQAAELETIALALSPVDATGVH